MSTAISSKYNAASIVEKAIQKKHKNALCT